MRFSSRSLLATTSVLLAFVVLLPTTAAPSAAGADSTWHTDLDQAVDQAREQNAYVVVDLYAEWCGWCKKLEREVFPTPEFRAFAADKVLLRVDVEDGADGSRLQARHNAYNLPTTLILDADLVRVGQVIGYAAAESLVPRFEAEVATWERLMSRFPQILSQGSDSLRRSLVKELHQRADGRRAAQLYAKIIESAGAMALDTPWLQYKMADAHRLARDYETAEKAIVRARQMAQGSAGAGKALAEKLDLLSYQIAQDAGDCKQAKSSLQRFLDSHPDSKNRRLLARRLRALEHGNDAICT